MSEPKSILLSRLSYSERIDLRDAICSLKLVSNRDDNYYAQGVVMGMLGFDEHDAKYPNDTYVGTLRLQGSQD